MTPPARIYVKLYLNGAMATMEEPFEGATEYRCAECLESIGGRCRAHVEEEEDGDG